MTLLSSRRYTVRSHSAIQKAPKPTINMRNVATIILGGGQGTRLAPLTLTRCKPAVCFGGKYRLIDIPISHAIHSGSSRIFVLTQFLSSSLHKHIYNTYHPGSFASAAIELMPAEQGPNNKSWFQGTADAIRQNLHSFYETSAEYFLILSGDQLYNIDFRNMMQFALETDADLVIAALPIEEKDAKRLGVLKLNEDRFVTEFYEKPQEKEILEHMKSPLGIQNRQHLGSMGIYLFKRKALFDLLLQDPREDFGKHLIPTKVQQGKVAAYLYDGYWEDIGTIDSFFKANLAMTRPNPPFNCYDELNPIFSHIDHLPPPKIHNTIVKDSILCEGCKVDADEVTNSILGPRTIVKAGTIIRNSYVMGNDFYAPPTSGAYFPTSFQIGSNCIIDHAIIDKHAHIGNGVQLVNKQKLMDYTSDSVCIRDGIIIVTRGATVPDGFVL